MKPKTESKMKLITKPKKLLVAFASSALVIGSLVAIAANGPEQMKPREVGSAGVLPLTLRSATPPAVQTPTGQGRADPGFPVAATPSPLNQIYDGMLESKNWREASASAKMLGQAGEEAIPLLVKGTQHESLNVRDACYRVLQENFPSHPETIKANISGIADPCHSWLNVRCALALSRQKARESIPELMRIAQIERMEPIVRFACARALGELGEAKSFPLLYKGLGSDGLYVRLYANAGVKALCGKDLTAYNDYNPQENQVAYGAFVATIGDPIVGAQWKAKRWECIVYFTKWIKQNRRDLYVLLSNSKQ